MPKHNRFDKFVANGIVAFHEMNPNLFSICRYISRNYDDLIILLFGHNGKLCYSAWDTEKHEVRWRRPYFYKDDPVQWNIS